MTSSRPGPRRFTVTERREAMEVRADNLDDVAAWCGGEAYVTRDEAVTPSAVWYVNGLGKPVTAQTGDFAYVGDVLVTDGSRWWDVPREEFDRMTGGWTEETT